MKKILFGGCAIFLLWGLAACASPTAVEPNVEPAASAVAESEPTAEAVAEIEPAATLPPPATPTPAPVATDLPAPRVEPTTETAAVETPPEEPEAQEEEVAADAEPEQPEGDTAEVAAEPFYGRTAEGVFAVGYDSATVKIIDYSDFL